MVDKQQELEELFSMFHDFDIISAEHNQDILNMHITIPWGSMWIKDDYTYTIKIELTGCEKIRCVYYKIMSDKLIPIGDNKLMRDTEERITTDAKDLKDLKLSIQGGTFIKPDSYELHCISDNDIDFATLKITANDYHIFDQEGKEISLDTMKKWGTDWWDGIQKMWDEQKTK